MESLKIIGLSIVAAIVYGIVHDQITARICVEYFTIFHPPVFPTHSPTLLGIGWGIIATWWVGAVLGVLLALSARAGSRSQFEASDLVRPIFALLCVMALCALTAGLAGFLMSRAGRIEVPAGVGALLPLALRARFMADWYAHSASYASGFFGGLFLCGWIIWKRIRARVTVKSAQVVPIQ
jgi:H+/Cl- antiporter ClcA